MYQACLKQNGNIPLPSSPPKTSNATHLKRNKVARDGVKAGRDGELMGYLVGLGVYLLALRDLGVKRHVLRRELAHINGTQPEELVHLLFLTETVQRV